MGPFPQYDTEYVQEVRNEITKMEKDNDNNYDELPVECCTHCKSLHITIDEENNNICNRCGSVNEIETLDDIYEYKSKYGKIWE